MKMLWGKIKCFFGKHGNLKDGCIYWMSNDGLHQWGQCKYCGALRTQAFYREQQTGDA